MSKDEIFQSGERELKKAFEETTTRNVIMILEYSKETRKLLRELEEKVTNLHNSIMQKEETISQLRKQLAVLQQKIYSGGS